MAATITTSAWGKKPGAWALDSEQNEQEELKKAEIIEKSPVEPEKSDFPSLSLAAAVKTKKKKAQKVSLAEFTKPVPKFQPLVLNEPLVLPTGPRERTSEELENGTRGFRSYGPIREKRGDRDAFSDSSRADDSGDWGKKSVEKREKGFFGESKADESDNWGSNKKSFESRGTSSDNRGFGSDNRGKADESDNWGANKKSFESRGIGSDSNRDSKADESDNWVMSKSGNRGFDNNRRSVGFGSSGGSENENWHKKQDENVMKIGGAFDSLRDRRGGVDDNIESWGKKQEEKESIGVVSDRPRLKLQPRSVPISEENGSNGSVLKVKGSNPFGEARPREEVLKEKGKDWKEIDEKLESMKVKEVEGFVGKRGFGNGSNGGSERSWRKPNSVDASPKSADKTENGIADKAENGIADKAENGIADKAENGVAEEAGVTEASTGLTRVM